MLASFRSYNRTPLVGEIYRHYKGNFYEIVAKATHTETKEELVIYRCVAVVSDVNQRITLDHSNEYNRVVSLNKLWARPVKMFMGRVEHNPALYRFYQIEKDYFDRYIKK
jgi:hypothetical protein